MKFTFALKLALFGFLMIVLFIYSTTGAISLGAFKYVAVVFGMVFFPAGVQMIIRNLKKANKETSIKILK